MFTIRKSFEISASHCLTHLADDHPCKKVHGHNYVITVELQASTEKPENLRNGFVMDYRELDKAKKIIMEWDHQHLNSVVDHPTTSEFLAYHLFHRLRLYYPALSAIEVSETPKTTCRYEPA